MTIQGGPLLEKAVGHIPDLPSGGISAPTDFLGRAPLSSLYTALYLPILHNDSHDAHFTDVETETEEVPAADHTASQ